MFFHLKMLSSIALESIHEIDIQSGLIPNSKDKTKRIERKLVYAKAWGELDINPEYGMVFGELMSAVYDTLKSLDNDLLIKYKDSPKLQSIIVEFPQMYLDSVVELTYPQAYVACFMDNCTNSSIWGTYGNNHTGVCLKFKTNKESNECLPLKAITSYSGNGKHYDYREFPLRPMEYSSIFDELDFFRNLGRLPMRQLQDQWYSDDDGNLSICCEDIFSKVDEWRNQYWSAYESAYLKKLPAWSHEREYRIILSSVLDSYDKPEDRLLEYKFEDLEEIIFGMKTPKEAKMQIIEIVNRKCKEFGRNHFDFYEMAYSNSKNELYPRKLLSLNLNSENDFKSTKDQ